ncbi:hypothetical protein QJQ45_015965 [Haematococcus lacustris]|nr:hypothetical protein QJQ45_015965 [Haematococcus lacustris]
MSKHQNGKAGRKDADKDVEGTRLRTRAVALGVSGRAHYRWSGSALTPGFMHVQMLAKEAPMSATSFPPSRALVRCNGQDIIKKSSIRKNRYLLVLNCLLAPTAGGRLGVLAQLDSRSPVLYLDFPSGRLKLWGTLVFPHNKYMVLRTGGTAGVVCEDVFENMIVFSEAWWVGREEDNPQELRLPMPADLQRPDPEQAARVPDYNYGAAQHAAVSKATATAAQDAPEDSEGPGSQQPVATPASVQRPRRAVAVKSYALRDDVDDDDDDGDEEDEPPETRLDSGADKAGGIEPGPLRKLALAFANGSAERKDKAPATKASVKKGAASASGTKKNKRVESSDEEEQESNESEHEAESEAESLDTEVAPQGPGTSSEEEASQRPVKGKHTRPAATTAAASGSGAPQRTARQALAGKRPRYAESESEASDEPGSSSSSDNSGGPSKSKRLQRAAPSANGRATANGKAASKPRGRPKARDADSQSEEDEPSSSSAEQGSDSDYEVEARGKKKDNTAARQGKRRSSMSDNRAQEQQQQPAVAQ